MRRINPRHTTTVLQVRPYAEDDSWVGTFGEPVRVRAQVEHSRVVTVDSNGTRVVTVLTARIPPRTDGTGPTATDFPPGTEVTIVQVLPPTSTPDGTGYLDAALPAEPSTDGLLDTTTVRASPSGDGSLSVVATEHLSTETSWVLATRPVFWHGSIAYLELTTGERPPRAAGGVEVTAVLHRAAGYDRYGDPTPAQDTQIPSAVLVPRTTDEPLGAGQTPTTTADLITPLALAVSSTDQVEVLQPGYAAGWWQVDGDPAAEGDRLRVPLRRM